MIKQTYKVIVGLIALTMFLTCLSFTLNHLQKPGPLENIEKRLDEAAEKDSNLTENEQKLKTEAQTKEWEEVDEKQIVPLPKPK